jgi:hypothetical protein
MFCRAYRPYPENEQRPAKELKEGKQKHDSNPNPKLGHRNPNQGKFLYRLFCSAIEIDRAIICTKIADVVFHRNNLEGETVFLPLPSSTCCHFLLSSCKYGICDLHFGSEGKAVDLAQLSR